MRAVVMAAMMAGGLAAGGATAQERDCGAVMEARCAERFGAGATAVDQKGCTAQRQAYRACVAAKVEAARPRGAEADPAREASAKEAYEAVRTRGSARALRLVAEKFPGTFWGALAAEDASRLEAAPAAAAPAAPAATPPTGAFGPIAAFLPPTGERDPIWEFRTESRLFEMANWRDAGAITYFYATPEAAPGWSRISTDVAVETGADDSGFAGLIYGLDERDRSYNLFVLKPDGRVIVFRRDRNGFRPVMETASTVVRPGRNRLEITETGATITLTVNGETVGALGADRLGQLGVGIAAGGMVRATFNGFSAF